MFILTLTGTTFIAWMKRFESYLSFIVSLGNMGVFSFTVQWCWHSRQRWYSYVQAVDFIFPFVFTQSKQLLWLCCQIHCVAISSTWSNCLARCICKWSVDAVAALWHLSFMPHMLLLAFNTHPPTLVGVKWNISSNCKQSFEWTEVFCACTHNSVTVVVSRYYSSTPEPFSPNVSSSEWSSVWLHLAVILYWLWIPMRQYF